MLYVLLVISVFGTSVLSGVLGMAGGMVLMAILVATLSVANAMLLHGAVQGMANGSRAWFLRKHILWTLLPPYCVGAALSLGGFSLLTLVPDASVILILVGLFPWLARFSRYMHGLDITHPPTAVLCGTVVTSAQLFAGASGPLLDVFYLKSPLTRQQIVASKAVTQTLGHLLKIVYYGTIISVSSNLPGWLFVAAIISAVLGTRVGTMLLNQWNDEAFQRASSVAILTIATLCVISGIGQLLFG